MDAVTNVPHPANEPVLTYAPNSPERASLMQALDELQTHPVDLTMTIGGEQRMGGGGKQDVVQPHNHRHVLGTLGEATQQDAKDAIDAAAKAGAGLARAVLRRPRRGLPQGRRPALRPVAGPLNAATMLGQSKTAQQAEIDAACELVDFWRFNVAFARQILQEQPISARRRVEPHRLPAARGLRLRDHAVQLHRDRRQPAHRPGADGQHRAVEAVGDPAVLRAPADAAAGGGRPARRRDQHADRDGIPVSEVALAAPGPGGHPLHRLDARPSSTCGTRSAATSTASARTRGSSARPAARTSCSPTPAPTRPP